MPEAKNQDEQSKKAAGKDMLKNQNPNEQHNSKKEALGPNTKR